MVKTFKVHIEMISVRPGSELFALLALFNFDLRWAEKTSIFKAGAGFCTYAGVSEEYHVASVSGVEFLLFLRLCSPRHMEPVTCRWRAAGVLRVKHASALVLDNYCWFSCSLFGRSCRLLKVNRHRLFPNNAGTEWWRQYGFHAPCGRRVRI